MIALWMIALIVSLIAFPEFMPHTFAFWLVVFTVKVYRGKRAWPFLAVIPLLIAIKWPEFNWPLRIFGAGCLFIAVDYKLDVESKKETLLKAQLVQLVVIWVCWLFYAVCFHLGCNASNTLNLEAFERPVVCLGDSLTDYGYPNELTKLVNVPIADYGFDGYKTSDGLKLIPEIVALKPQVVVLELGGHDYNNGYPRAETREGLSKLISAFEASGATVVLVEIPRGFINDPYFGLERELSSYFDLQLIPDSMIRRLCYWSPVVPPGSFFGKELHNSNDGLHPNERGNKLMAAYVAAALQKVLGPKVVK